MTTYASSRRSLRRRLATLPASNDRRGNTLVLVTAILVLLVIIATAYISRTQGGRIIAAAQRKAIDREDRADLAAGVVSREIADTLFPKLVDPSDPAIRLGFAATSSRPRLSRPFWNGQKLDRYMVDPQLNANGGPLAPYNHAPYETRAWTNWPDSAGPGVPFGPGGGSGRLYDANGLTLGDDNPIGNPGFGDSRWLRSTEPERAYDTVGRLGFDNASSQAGFTHWSHLSWPASAENGWRVCFDIANVAPFQGDYQFDPTAPDDIRPREGFTLTRTAAELIGSGTASDYLLFPDPVALQTPYEQWLPGNVPPRYAGTADFILRRNLWFSAPGTHFSNSVLYGPRALPNFIRLNDLGPRRHALRPGTDRNVVERTLADADGDGFTDSFWFLIPGTSEDGIRQVAAVSVVDNASMVDVNVATRFDRFSTAGETPADVALTSRLVQPGSMATQFGANASVYDPNDTWTGLLSDPQNVSGGLWNLGFAYEAEFLVQPGTFDAPGTLQTSFDPLRFGDSTSAPSSFLRQTGVLNQNLGATGFAALEAPYRSLMVSFGGGDPERAAFDRRRYFHRRQNDGGLFTIRSAADGSPLSVDDWSIGNVPPRGFTDADEIELRMFAASNYGPAVSTLERTLNEPWNYQANFLRSSLARSESVENFLDYYDGNESTPWPPSQGIAIGDQLSAIELLRDNRHRITTYSTTRNDLRPLHLRPTALYNPDFDYAFGRLRFDQGTPPDPVANQLAFDVRKQKVDLRAPTDTPLTEFESILYRFFPGPFRVRASGDVDLMLAGVWPGSLGAAFDARVELDRSFRFRLELQQTIAKAASAVVRDSDDTPYAQSYLGSNYEDITLNQQDYLLTQLLAASWSANIDTFRDARPRPAVSYNFAGSGGLGQVEPIELDTPIFPDWAPRTTIDTDSFLPAELRNLTFPGMEKQPFIMEAFFGLVYPPSRISPETALELDGDQGYQQLLQQQGESRPEAGDDEIPFGFRGSGDKWVDADSRPAIVFAIQLANPYEEPVPLHDVFIRIGDSGSLNQCLNLAKLPSPHPLSISTGDTDPVTGQQRTSPYYFPSELFLGPTQPEAPRTAIVFGIIPPGNTVDSGFEDEFGVPYEEFHEKWMDFLDLESGALFGWDAGLPMSQHQTMVFDASPQTYARVIPGTPGQPFKPVIPPLVGLTPDRWFDDIDQSVELLRFVVDPLAPDAGGGLPTSGYLYAIDRLDNDLTGAKIEFSDQMERIVEDDFAPTMPQEYSFTFGGPPDRNEWSGIRLEGGDMLASWVRAGRAWGWDVNRNGVYDMTETSPRYVMSEIPEDDWVQTEVEAVVVGQGGRQINGAIIDWDEDPDTPWMARSYLSPLALVPVAGTGSADGSYSYEFGTIRGKPTHLTTATALQPGGTSPFSVDYDAGFPVLADGSVRSAVNPTGGPGRPASQYRWVLMDKGQEQDETLPGNRAGVTTGADGNGNGVDDGLETYQRIWLEKDQWAYPLQMLQKDADFEQVGEVFNPFLWGHAITHRPGQTTPQTFGGIRLLPTFMTFGEIMNTTEIDTPLPVVRADLSPVGVPNPTRTRTNRFHADPGNPTAQIGAAVESFRAPTQVVEVTALSEPWTPLLPAGLTVLDGLVCDGAGCNYRLDLDGDGFLDPVELIAIEDARFGNAAGFGGKGTRGLINVNTAPVEVLRTLPHMSRLVYNDTIEWPGTTAGGAPAATAWNGYAPSVPRAGDVQDNAVPRELSTRNIQYNRAAEAIDQYRRGGGVYDGGGIEPRRVEQVGLPFGADVALPYYDDRGTFNYTASTGAPQFAAWVTDNIAYPEIPGTPGLFPGMRRGAGITSLGEMMLLERIGIPTAQVTQSWPQRSAAITGAALDPYAFQRDLGFGNTWGASGQPWNPAAGTPDVNTRLGLGWRGGADASTGQANGPALQTDARLSTDRLNVSWPQDRWNAATTVELPDNVAGDAEEANLLFAGISNLVSVRSDVFTVHLKLRSFKQNPVTGVWNATDPEFIVDDSRYVFVVDRSRCELPGDEPEIRLFSKIPN